MNVMDLEGRKQNKAEITGTELSMRGYILTYSKF